MYIEDEEVGSAYARMRTARQRKRAVKKAFDKQLIHLAKKEKSLRIQKRNLPWVPLEVPYQKGWKRFFVLREDVARSAAAEFYHQLLPKINTTIYAADQSFIRRKKRKKGRKQMPIPQALRAFYPYEWESPKLALTANEKLHFFPKVSFSPQHKGNVMRYTFIEPWRYVLKIAPHLVTHTQMVDRELESEIAYIDNYLTRHHLRPIMLRRVTGKGKWKWRYTSHVDYKNVNPLKTLSLNDFLLQAGYFDTLNGTTESPIHFYIQHG